MFQAHWDGICLFAWCLQFAAGYDHTCQVSTTNDILWLATLFAIHSVEERYILSSLVCGCQQTGSRFIAFEEDKDKALGDQ